MMESAPRVAAKKKLSSMKESFMRLSNRAGHTELRRPANRFKIIWYWFCTSLYSFPVSGWKRVNCAL